MTVHEGEWNAWNGDLTKTTDYSRTMDSQTTQNGISAPIMYENSFMDPYLNFLGEVKQANIVNKTLITLREVGKLVTTL